MKNILFLLLLLPVAGLQAQTTNQILQKAHQRFSTVKSFKSDVQVRFNLPSISIENMKGVAYYKAPSKFRIKLTGIAFLPKDNPFDLYKLIRDSTQYTSVLNGREKAGGEMCRIISVIPNNDPDIMLAKVWIGDRSGCPVKMEITSRTNGVVTVENTYGLYTQNALPDKMCFSIDMNKFKVPKALAADINNTPKPSGSTADRSKGSIEFVFGKYTLNTPIDDSVFKEPENMGK
ncbi:MAG: hypothetical protein EP344_09845 [Bacteroidetes bacterium]|nr:MAG: hypothetical protein EP344_09845 [Bacteroidota bacterium]